jgi:hypothetical protein
MYTNAQILAAVLNKWAQPIVQTLLSGKVQSFGFLQNLEAKIKSTGWVSSNYSLLKDLNPLMESITGSVMQPVLNQYLSQLDDASIPKMAHDIVDNALKQGSLNLFEGNIELEKEDLEELKKLLDYNLPIKADSAYEVKME